jgi:7-cyano-7-deazaguanine synthase in queuosine biosynthesis
MVRTLINLSGGIDSTYMLWKWKDKENLLVHHIYESEGGKAHYFSCGMKAHFKPKNI